MALTPAQIEDVYRTRYVGFRNALVPVAGGFEPARDAVQEGFALALRRRRSFRGDGSPEAWIWRIAYREALRIRRLSPATELEEVVDGATELGVLGDPALAAALRALPPRRKLVVFLRYYGDLSYAEIGELCGISAGTVAATLAQAHAELGSVLEPEGAVL